MLGQENVETWFCGHPEDSGVEKPCPVCGSLCHLLYVTCHGDFVVGCGACVKAYDVGLWED